MIVWKTKLSGVGFVRLDSGHSGREHNNVGLGVYELGGKGNKYMHTFSHHNIVFLIHIVNKDYMKKLIE